MPIRHGELGFQGVKAKGLKGQLRTVPSSNVYKMCQSLYDLFYQDQQIVS